MSTDYTTYGLEEIEVPKINKQSRRDLHAAINALTREEVAEIVREQYPRARGKRIDELAKELIGQAHRLVSPRR